MPATAGACPRCGRVNPPDALRCAGCSAWVGPAPVALGPSGGAAPLDPAARAGQPTRHALLEMDRSGERPRRTHPLGPGKTVVGRAADLAFPEDATLSSRHAAFEVSGERCTVSDLASTNGTYVAVKGFHVLHEGDVVLVGSQRLLYRRTDPAGRERGHQLVEVVPRGRQGRTHSLGERTVIIGKDGADLSFAGDELLSRRHAEIVWTGRAHAVHDLSSRNRSFVMVHGATPLEDGDRVVVGTRLFLYRRESA